MPYAACCSETVLGESRRDGTMQGSEPRTGRERRIARLRDTRRSTMTGIHCGLSGVVALLFIGGGAIAVESAARSSSGVVADDAAKKATDPIGGTIRGAAGLPVQRRIPERPETVPPGQIRRGRAAVHVDRPGSQGDHLGRARSILPGRVPVSAREVRQRPGELRTSARRLPRDRVSREARRPRVRDRTALARAGRSRATRRTEAARDCPSRPRAAGRRHPRIGDPSAWKPSA